MADLAAEAAAKRPFDERRLAVVILLFFSFLLERAVAWAANKKPGAWPGCSLEVRDAYAAAGIAVSASRTSRMTAASVSVTRRPF
jgi:hypothetical protein